MNILIKLTCLVGLVIAPILGGDEAHNHAEDAKANTDRTEIVATVNE
jgi:hypothetical protein